MQKTVFPQERSQVRVACSWYTTRCGRKSKDIISFKLAQPWLGFDPPARTTLKETHTCENRSELDCISKSSGVSLLWTSAHIYCLVIIHVSWSVFVSVINCRYILLIHQHLIMFTHKKSEWKLMFSLIYRENYTTSLIRNKNGAM